MNHGKFFDSIRISPENLAKMKRHREAVAGLEEVPIICRDPLRQSERSGSCWHPFGEAC